MKKKKIDLSQFDDEALLLDGCDSAIQMVTDCGEPVYSYSALLKIFQAKGLTEAESVEWVCYNIIGLKGNGGFHIAHETLWEEE